MSGELDDGEVVSEWITRCLISRVLCIETVLSSPFLPSKVTFVKSLINISNNGETGSAVPFSPLRLNAPRGHNGS